MKCADVKSNINFKTKYNFVSSMEAFDRIARGTHFSYNMYPNTDKLYTYNIRTCTAGVIVNSKKISFIDYFKKVFGFFKRNSDKNVKRQGIGFHQFDNRLNAALVDVCVDTLLHGCNPLNAVIVGGKRLSSDKGDISMKMFNRFNEMLQEKIKKVTIFGEHVYPYSETHLAYDAKLDECTLCHVYKESTNIHLPEEYVKDQQTLKKCFKYIHIDKGDKLFFDGVPCDYH